jgi:hypothetical protein
MNNEQMIGAIKIRDGLFIGDSFAAKDFDFVVANKVTKIVNCSGRTILNNFTRLGVEYLTFRWLDAENQIILDENDDTAD